MTYFTTDSLLFIFSLLKLVSQMVWERRQMQNTFAIARLGALAPDNGWMAVLTWYLMPKALLYYDLI